MKPGYTIVAFYTPEYEAMRRPFLEACTRLGAPVVTRKMNSRGQWEKNTALKPLALEYLRTDVRGTILYLDIDTRILKLPALPPGKWDVATAPNPVKAHVCNVNAAAFFLADTPRIVQFLHEWREWVRENVRRDHPGLMWALRCPPSPLAWVNDADFAGCFAINGLAPQRTQILT
jgi:hypothetical protein